MATNEILQFAGSASGAEILSQAAYSADADRTDGHDPGSIARAELENKVLLQTSTIAAAVAQFMADSQSNNITDGTAIATLAGYLKTAIKNVSILFTTAGGTSDAITAAFTPATTALGDGKFMIVRAGAANATSTPTLAVDGLTAKTIVKGSNAALALNDIPGAGFYMLLTYDSVLDKYVLNNPAATAGSGSSSILHVRDVKASGSNGGSFAASAWRTRTLNTVVTNTIAGASLASNQITLASGTYKVSARAPGFQVAKHQTKLVNITDTVDELIGSTSNTSASGTDPVQTDSTVLGILTVSGSKVFELQHRCSSTKNTNGFGPACSFGINEIYSEVFIEQIS